MPQIINSPLLLLGSIFLIVGSIVFHGLIAKRFGAANATTGRVTIYAISVTTLLCLAIGILAVTVMPEIANRLNNGFNVVGIGDAILSAQWFATLIGIFAALVVATLIFTFCVDLAPIKSFFAVSLGALATLVATLALTPIYETYMMSRQTAGFATPQLLNDNADAVSRSSKRKYFGGLQSKRLALQDMGHNICMCENEVECVKTNYTKYQKYSSKHAKSFGEDEVTDFLQDLDNKVNDCAATLYADNTLTRPSSTEATLEQAIATYYAEHGKWANTYAVKQIQKLESRISSTDAYEAHVRFRYSPTKHSSKHSDGIDNRTFTYQKNQDGSYTVIAMGGPDSAIFDNQVREIQASYHPLSSNSRVDSLLGHKGRKIKITQFLGEPLAGTLEHYDENELTISINRRDGKIGYQLDRSNIASMEVWY